MLKKYLPAFSSLNGFNLVALKAILATEADKKAATVAATVEDAPKPEDNPVVDAEYTEAKPEGETLPVVQSAA